MGLPEVVNNKALIHQQQPIGQHLYPALQLAGQKNRADCAPQVPTPTKKAVLHRVPLFLNDLGDAAY